THRAGENAIFKEGFTHTADGFNVPNEVVVVGRSERDEDGNETEPPRALAWNQDPNDPYSIPSRGYTITAEPIQEQDATSLDVLRSEEHTSELQSRENLVCRLLLEKK